MKFIITAPLNMKFNIVIIQPENYIHSAAFTEVAEIVAHSLNDLGHYVDATINTAYPDATNIFIGIHLLPPAMLNRIPEGSIIINTEQLYNNNNPWNSIIFDASKKYQIWDYSEKNILKFHEIGSTNPKLLKLGFHEKLIRIEKRPYDIDVLFYGSMNDRRNKIIESLKAAKLNTVSISGIYGEERDELISRSKIILNMHYYESQIFEIVRCFYPMINSKAIVAEVGTNTSIDEIYKDGILCTNYEEIVQQCINLSKNPSQLEQLEKSALKTIQKLPQINIIQDILK